MTIQVLPQWDQQMSVEIFSTPQASWPSSSGTKPWQEKQNLSPAGPRSSVAVRCCQIWEETSNSSADGCWIFCKCFWRDSGKCAALLEELSVETCSLSLTVLLRIGRRMEAITSASSWERAKPLHINQHYSIATVYMCRRKCVTEHLPVVTFFITSS